MKVTSTKAVWILLWLNWIVVDLFGTNIITMFVLALVSGIVIQSKSGMIETKEAKKGETKNESN